MNYWWLVSENTLDLSSTSVPNTHLLMLDCNEILYISTLTFHTDRYCQKLISIYMQMLLIKHIHHHLESTYGILLDSSLDICLLAIVQSDDSIPYVSSHNDSTLPLWWESGYRQYVNEWACYIPIKVIYGTEIQTSYSFYVSQKFFLLTVKKCKNHS